MYSHDVQMYQDFITHRTADVAYEVRSSMRNTDPDQSSFLIRVTGPRYALRP